jgi:hypothetical protein
MNPVSRLAAGALAAVAVSSWALPSSADTCPNHTQSMGRTIHDTLVHNPAVVIEKFVGADAQVGIAAYNRLPDPGHDQGDTFYIAFDPTSHTTYMAVAKGDCLVSNGYWLDKAGLLVRSVIERARGRSI